MHALVVYQSMSGNTRRIAEAVAEGLGSTMEVRLVEVAAAPAVVGDDVALLVVGGPTHAFGMGRGPTRQSVVRQAGGPLVPPGRGLREWLVGLRTSSPRLGSAAFDTRVVKPRTPGTAARAVARRLRAAGVRMVAPAQSFSVTGAQGRPAAGELERARRWGETLAAVHAVPSGP